MTSAARTARARVFFRTFRGGQRKRRPAALRRPSAPGRERRTLHARVHATANTQSPPRTSRRPKAPAIEAPPGPRAPAARPRRAHNCASRPRPGCVYLCRLPAAVITPPYSAYRLTQINLAPLHTHVRYCTGTYTLRSTPTPPSAAIYCTTPAVLTVFAKVRRPSLPLPPRPRPALPRPGLLSLLFLPNYRVQSTARAFKPSHTPPRARHGRSPSRPT